jgi:hypothetical protein
MGSQYPSPSRARERIHNRAKVLSRSRYKATKVLRELQACDIESLRGEVRFKTWRLMYPIPKLVSSRVITICTLTRTVSMSNRTLEWRWLTRPLVAIRCLVLCATSRVLRPIAASFHTACAWALSRAIAFAQWALMYKDVTSPLPPEKPSARLSSWIIELRNVPLIGFALLIISRLVDAWGATDFLTEIALSWKEFTRELWGNLFEWIDLRLAYQVSAYEYDLLTLSTLALSAVFVPAALDKWLRSPGSHGCSLWRQLKRATREKPVRKVVGLASPLIVMALLFFAFCYQNLREQFQTTAGQEHLRKQLIVLIGGTAMMLVLSVIGMLITFLVPRFRARWKMIAFVLFSIVLARPLFFVYTASFMPVAYWTYDLSTRYVANALLVLSSAFCLVAFIRNWRPFAVAVQWVSLIWVIDVLARLSSPAVQELQQRVRDTLDSL